MKNIWLTADTHLDHEAILRHTSRPFTTIDEMNEAIVEGINRHVNRNDLLIHAGDFGWKASRIGHWRQRLHVREIWVARGNHDAASLRSHVSRMDLILFCKLAGRKAVISHYPQFSWAGRERGAVHLYGHSHGRSEAFLNANFPNRFAMDVGIDYIHLLTGEWRPIHFDEILERLGCQD